MLLCGNYADNKIKEHLKFNYNCKCGQPDAMAMEINEIAMKTNEIAMQINVIGRKINETAMRINKIAMQVNEIAIISMKCR